MTFHGRASGPIDADVAIVGAGPAGAATACHFARAGFQVVLLDQRRFPRDKVCGDFVGPWALEELDRLGVSGHASVCNGNRIRRAELHLNGNTMERFLPRADGIRDYGLCIPRIQLDDAIVRAARASGAELIEEACATGYETDANGVTLCYEDGGKPERLRGRALFGADGSASVIARTLRGKQPP